MAYRDLREFVARLEEEGLLVRVREQVDWHLEIGALMSKVFSARGPAVLFENVKDSPYPLLSGAMCAKEASILRPVYGRRCGG